MNRDSASEEHRNLTSDKDAPFHSTREIYTVSSDMDALGQYADDRCIDISSNSLNDSVFDESHITISSTASTDILTHSVSDDTNGLWSASTLEEPSLKMAYNICGRRFEMGRGTNLVNNDIIQLKPVS